MSNTNVDLERAERLACILDLCRARGASVIDAETEGALDAVRSLMRVARSYWVATKYARAVTALCNAAAGMESEPKHARALLLLSLAVSTDYSYDNRNPDALPYLWNGRLDGDLMCGAGPALGQLEDLIAELRREAA